MNCVKCHATLPADAVFCPDCGAESGATQTSPAPAYVARTFRNLPTITPIRESHAAVLEPGTMFANRYEVIRKLGEGGMGVVYVVKDTNTKEEIVLKLIHPDLIKGEDAVQRLMAEGLTARQIRHPNIVAVYDVALADGQPYFTMEFVKSGTLRSWMINAIRSSRETSVETAAGLLKSMLAGLAEAHRMGVVHRDLKPENVLLCGAPDAGDFSLKIVDFGIAKAVRAPTTARDGSGGAIGTEGYMAPEQKTSAEAVGPPADFYALTVMFYELLMEAQPQGPWEPVSKSRPDVPKAVDDLIQKGLSVRPRSRFKSAAEYEAALDAAIGPPSVHSGGGESVVVGGRSVSGGGSDAGGAKSDSWDIRVVFGSLSKRAKMSIYAIAALVVLGIIGNSLLDTREGPMKPPVDVNAPQPNPQRPVAPSYGDITPPPASVPAAKETWYNDMRNSFTVSRRGQQFEAQGTWTGLGPVIMRGPLSQRGFAFGVYNAITNNRIGEGRGFMRDERHIQYEITDGRGNFLNGLLHINHLPHQ